MSAWTDFRDSVTGGAKGLFGTGIGILTNPLGTAGSLLGGGGLMGILGGGTGQYPQGGTLGGTMSTFGTGPSDSLTGQYGSLMDMLTQRFSQQGQIGQTGTSNLSNQGLI